MINIWIEEYEYSNKQMTLWRSSARAANNNKCNINVTNIDACMQTCIDKKKVNGKFEGTIGDIRNKVLL